MTNFMSSCRAMTALLCASAALVPATATAQTALASPDAEKWQFTAELYGYFPEITGKVNYRGDSGSTDIDVPFHDLLDALKMGFMGALGAHNGRWGMFADALYMDLETDKSRTRDFTVGGSTVPVTADVSTELKAWVWTLAGDYRVVSNPDWTVDLLAGARSLYLKPTLDYTIAGPLRTINGSKGSSTTFWDGIVGIKGRYAFGDNREWYVPFYLDVGTGDTDLTWQAVAGIGYSYHWGDLLATWRYLDWNGKSGKPLADLTLSGPMLGVALHW
jgi:hypothetical protein